MVKLRFITAIKNTNLLLFGVPRAIPVTLCVKNVAAFGKVLELHERANEFEARTPRDQRHRSSLRVVTRNHKRPQPLMNSAVHSRRAPPKQPKIFPAKVALKEVQSNNEDVDKPSSRQNPPPRESLGPLPSKSPKSMKGSGKIAEAAGFSQRWIWKVFAKREPEVREAKIHLGNAASTLGTVEVAVQRSLIFPPG